MPATLALVPGTVDLAVVHAAERDDEFIARLASERTGLGDADNVGERLPHTMTGPVEPSQILFSTARDPPPPARVGARGRRPAGGGSRSFEKQPHGKYPGEIGWGR